MTDQIAKTKTPFELWIITTIIKNTQITLLENMHPGFIINLSHILPTCI